MPEDLTSLIVDKKTAWLINYYANLSFTKPTMKAASTKSPKISVIMPVYNAAKTLSKATQSIQNQTFDDWELIILDDGSTDSSCQIAAQHARGDPRIKLIKCPRRGIATTLNEGLVLSKGHYIARMDADDVSLPNRLLQQSQFLDQNHSVDLVSSLVKFGGDPEKAKGYAHYVEWINTILSEEAIKANRFVESPFAHPSVMFRTKTVETYGGYQNNDWPEDYQLWLKWLECGVRMAKIEDPLLIWNDPPDRLSRSHSNYSINAFIECKNYFLITWLKKHVHSRPIAIWGAGRTSLKRSQSIFDSGLDVVALFDVDQRKIGKQFNNISVHSTQFLINASPKPFVLNAVGSRKARPEIEKFLTDAEYSKEKDFLSVC